MPELPDLQVFSKNLLLQLKGKKLKRAEILHGKKFHATAKELKTLEGQNLKNIYRQGKQLYFSFGKETLSMHLMLHGKLVLQQDKALPQYALFSLQFEDDTQLVLTDFQKMANITFNPEPTEVMDALSEKLTAEWLQEQLQKSRASIKAFLTDQKIIGGIGNAYADEILWEARIAPQSKANKIPHKEAVILAKAIRHTLIHAEKAIQKANPDIISGEVRDFLSVHSSHKKNSPTGKPILTEKIGGRTTYYTEEQVLFQ